MLTGPMISPPKPLYPTKTYFTKEYHIFWEGVGGWGLQQWSTSQLNNHHQKKPPPKRCNTVHITASAYKTYTAETLWFGVHSYYKSNWSAGGGKRRETGYLAIHSTTLTRRTVETQHQHAVRGGGFIYILKHFSSGLRDRLFEEPS